MNDKLKIIVFIGVIICIIIGFFFLLEKRRASYTVTTQIEKAAVSQGQKARKKTELGKDADLHEIYLPAGCFWGVE
ncbi:peptide methionine sulfoxide reductase, partial [Streptococcus pneumoniae]